MRDPAFAYPRSQLTGLIFLHVNSGLGARLTLFTTSTLNVRWCIHSILKKDGVEKEADKQMIARRRSNLALAYKDTLAITIIFLCNYSLRHCLNS